VAPSTTVAPPTTVPVRDQPGYSAASTISGLLTNSAADRSTVVQDAADIASCNNVNGAQSSLLQVIAGRQTLISDVQQVNMSQLSNGAVIQSDLVGAWTNSLDSDQSYEAWAVDEEGTCTPNDTSDANYQDAAQSDQASTQSKQAFVAVWNPVATQFGLPTVTQSSI
jgi:uncharacterized protein (DUF885 family)